MTKIKSKKNYDLSIFKDDEIRVIDNVIGMLKVKNVKEISQLSHQEDAWLKNKDRDLISYDYAEELKIIFD